MSGRAASLGWSVVFILVANAGILGINAAMIPYASGGTMFLGWLLGLIVVVVAAGAVSKKLSGAAGPFVAVILLAVLSLVYAALGGRLPKALFLRESPAISVSDADLPAHAGCDVFHFTDGRVHPTLRGLRSQTTKTRGFAARTVSYQVAPLVPEGWKASDPIPAWVAAVGALPASWSQDLRGGYRVDSEPLYREIIEETTARHRLTSRGGAPILVWERDPRAALLAIARVELGILIAADLVILASLVVPLFFRKRPMP